MSLGFAVFDEKPRLRALLDHFAILADPRDARRILHRLDEVLLLGQQAVADKSNEINAIPLLVARLAETAAASPPHGETAPVDPQAGFARRSGKPGFAYGYKAHLGVDEGSGIIRSAIATPANVNDTTPADALIRSDERTVLADAAYHTHARQKALKARGVKARLMRRANKHHPLLPPRLARYNQLIARRRAAVETTFATWKRRMRFTAIRYIGLAKASAQILLAAMAFNMRRWTTLAP